MASFLSQHRFELSNGLVVERLPLGFAAGRWWASFVYAVPGWEGREPPVDWRTMKQAAWLHDPDGRLEPLGGGGGGTEREYQYTSELLDRGATRAHVAYVDDGVEVDSESLTLDPTDRTGCFTTRLTDGSLIERLPVGRANGFWRLRWVRSEVPRAETEIDDSEDADDDGLAMPDQRFIRLRSADGPVKPVAASGALGGAVQYFDVEVPDTVAPLHVDYLADLELVDSETLPLPPSVRGG